MRRILGLVFAVCILSCGLVFAVTQDYTVPAGAVTLKGTLIDNLCADGHKADIGTFIKKHTKECALMPNCAASGYSLYANGKMMKLDADSNGMAKEFLKDSDSKMDVEVEAVDTANGLSLVSIKNQ